MVQSWLKYKSLLSFTLHLILDLLVFYQVSLAIYGWLFEKPTTLSSAQTRPIQLQDLPSIRLCPQPSWDESKLEAAGYKKKAKNVFIGKVEVDSEDEVDKIGWKGIHGNMTYKQLSNISNPKEIIKNITLTFFYEKEFKRKWIVMNLAEIIPNYLEEGNCYVINFKSHLTNSNIEQLVDVRFQLSLEKATRIDFLVEDPNRLFFMKRRFDMEGMEIYSTSRQPAKKTYKIKVNVQKQLESDKKANCYDYGDDKEFESYNACRKKEFKSFLKPLTSCVPPILDEYEDSINSTCPYNENVTMYMKFKRQDKIKTNCKIPCTTIQYKSSKVRILESNSESEIIIIFDHNVTEWIASFSLSPMTVLESLGSSLGLWLGLGVLQMAEELGKLLAKFCSREK